MTTESSNYEFGTLEFSPNPLQIEIIKLLKEKKTLTRRDFVKLLRTPRTTIYDNLIKLQNRKLIEKYNRNNGKCGHPFVYWKLMEGK